MKTTEEIVNLVSKALELCPIKWVDINNYFVKFSYNGTIFKIFNDLSVVEVKDSCFARTLTAIFLELLLIKTNRYEK